MSIKDFLSFRNAVNHLDHSFIIHGGYYPFQMTESLRLEFEELKKNFDLFLVGNGDKVTYHLNDKETDDILKCFDLRGIGISKYRIITILFHLFQFHVVSKLPDYSDEGSDMLLKEFNKQFSVLFLKEMKKLARVEKFYHRYTDFNLINRLKNLSSFTSYMKSNPPQLILIDLNNSRRRLIQQHEVSPNISLQLNNHKKSSKTLGLFIPCNSNLVSYNDILQQVKEYNISIRNNWSQMAWCCSQFQIYTNKPRSLYGAFHNNFRHNLLEIIQKDQHSFTSSGSSNKYNQQSYVKHPIMELHLFKQPDLIFDIPISLKANKILSYLYNIEKDELKQSIIGIHQFTQCIYQALFNNVDYCILSNYDTIIIIKILSLPDEVNTVFSNGMVLHPIKCDFYILPQDSSRYSTNALLVGILGTMYDSFTRTIQDRIISLKENLINSIHNQLPDIVEKHNSYLKQMSNYTFSILNEFHYSEFFDELISDEIFSNTKVRFQPQEVRLLVEVIKLGWNQYTMEELNLSYELIEIISGSLMGQRIGIVLKIKDRITKQYYVMKFYEPIRSYVWNLYHMDVRSSFKYCTHYFCKEVACLKRLEHQEEFPDLISYGYVNNELPYQEELINTDNNLDSLSVRGYFIIISFIEGILVKDVRWRPPFASLGFKTLAKAHELGIYHSDISPSNMILNGEKVSLFDFGSSCLKKTSLDNFGTIEDEAEIKDLEKYDKHRLARTFSDSEFYIPSDSESERK